VAPFTGHSVRPYAKEALAGSQCSERPALVSPKQTFLTGNVGGA